MRLLLRPDGSEPTSSEELSDHQLAELYAPPPVAATWLRANMVATLDGAGTGPDGLTGSINNRPDHRVFSLLRSLADAVVVGAGTARAEGYRPVDRPTVVVSRRGQVPESLRGGAPGAVVLVTTDAAVESSESAAALGVAHVLSLGGDTVDLTRLRPRLAQRGMTSLLCEGGPSLLRALFAAEVVDELCATFVPRVLAGPQPRILTGAPVDVPLRLRHLLEEDGTLLGRWTV